MRVLLVEDDAILGAAVRDQIVADGHSVDWVTRLDDSTDHIRSAAYDLLLLDLMLPDGRGISFLRDLRTKGDVTPVIILTALDQISDRIEGLNAGADDYMVKPFDLSEQAQRLKSETTDPAVRDRAHQIETALQRLSRLSEKLLQLAKAERGNLLAEQAADIAPVLRIVVNESTQGAHGTGRIELKVPASPVLSDIDPDAFAILARNLIENALKHGTAGERVHVTLSREACWQ